MTGRELWELYNSYGEVYSQPLNEEVEEVDEGRIEQIKNRMTARYGKPEPRDTLRQHVARKKYDVAAAEHQSGWGSDPNASREGKLTKGQMMYKAHRSADAMRGNVNASYDYDLYDLVLEYLLDQGLCESVENAEIMMAHMSEQWIDSIIEEGMEEMPHLRQAMKDALRAGNQEKVKEIAAKLSDLQPKAQTKIGAELKGLNRRKRG